MFALFERGRGFLWWGSGNGLPHSKANSGAVVTLAHLRGARARKLPRCRTLLMRFFFVNQKVLLTGRPGCGKTTLIKHVVEDLAQGAGGFYTEEIRESGRRVGFMLVTLDGKEAVFAHVNFKTPERLGRYGLDLSALETIGVEAVREAVDGQRLVVIDEIGPMEIRSADFRDAVIEALDSEVPVLATIVARSLPFTNAIKIRSDVMMLEVCPGNRERLVFELSKKLESLNPG